MPRKPKVNGPHPKYGYYFKINLIRHCYPTEREADKAFAKAMNDHYDGKSTADMSIGQGIDLFLDHVEASQATSTYDWYRFPLRHFEQYIGRSRKASKLRLGDVTTWIDKNWRTTRYGKATSDDGLRHPKRAVKRCFKWLTDQDYIAKNPLSKLVIGDYVAAQDIPDKDKVRKVLKHWAKDTDFTDLLAFEALTATRVQEARIIKVADVDLKTSTITLMMKDSKGKEDNIKRRVIRIGDAMKIVKRQLAKRSSPDDLLFQNPAGRTEDKAWTTTGVRSRFRRAEDELGFRIKQRNLRHYWGTEYAKETKDVAGGAALMGHKNPVMFLKNYQHVLDDDDYLNKQAGKMKAKKLIG